MDRRNDYEFGAAEWPYVVRGRGEAEGDERDEYGRDFEFGGLENFSLDTIFEVEYEEDHEEEGPTPANKHTILELRLQLDRAVKLLANERKVSRDLMGLLQGKLAVAEAQRDLAQLEKRKSDRELRMIESELLNQVASLESDNDELQSLIGQQGQWIATLERERVAMEEWVGGCNEEFRRRLTVAQDQFREFLFATIQDYDRCLIDKHDEVDQLLGRVTSLERDVDMLDNMHGGLRGGRGRRESRDMERMQGWPRPKL